MEGKVCVFHFYWTIRIEYLRERKLEGYTTRVQTLLIGKEGIAHVSASSSPIHTALIHSLLPILTPSPEAIPDLTPLLAPSVFGDVATYLFFSLGGLFFGGELGLLGATVGVRNSLTKDPESQKRIETAFRRFKADVLRQEVAALEAGLEKGSGLGLF